MDINNVDFESLVKQARESESGFSQLYSAIQPYVMFKANTILGSNQDAEDVFQNVSVSIYRNLNNIDPKKFLGYLKNTVTNACNDVLRKRIKTTDDGYEIKTVEIDAFDDYKLPSESIGVDLDAEYRTQIFKEILDKIPVDCREVLVLKLIDEMTFKEISNQLNIPESTVKYRFASALKTAEQEIISIQKRDDIKLYGYSPLALFLLLFKGAAENEPFNPVLIDRTAKTIFNELSSDVSKEVIRNAGEELVKETTRKAVVSTASKTGASAIGKVLITGAIVSAVGIGGFVGYKTIQNNKEKQAMQSNAETSETDITPAEETVQDNTENKEEKWSKATLACGITPEESITDLDATIQCVDGLSAEERYDWYAERFGEDFTDHVIDRMDAQLIDPVNTKYEIFLETYHGMPCELVKLFAKSSKDYARSPYNPAIGEYDGAELYKILSACGVYD